MHRYKFATTYLQCWDCTESHHTDADPVWKRAIRITHRNWNLSLFHSRVFHLWSSYKRVVARSSSRGHLPAPWASASQHHYSGFLPSTRSADALYSLIIIFRAGAEAWELLSVGALFCKEWQLKENPPLGLLHWWTKPDWVLLIPAFLLLLQPRNKLQSRNQGCCVLQMHHLTPVLWR